MKCLLTGDFHYLFSDNSPKNLRGHLEFMASQNPKLVLVAGDLISHQQHELPIVCKLLRRIFKQQEIFIVFGNHDYWGMDTIEALYEYRKNILRESNIIWLQTVDPIKIEGVNFMGFDGWYWNPAPPTNDKYYMPTNVNKTLLNIATAKKDQIIKNLQSAQRAVILTHFEPNEHKMGGPFEWYMEFRAANPDCNTVLCCGHTHGPKDLIQPNFRLLNAGGDYEKPRSVLFEI